MTMKRIGGRFTPIAGRDGSGGVVCRQKGPGYFTVEHRRVGGMRRDVLAVCTTKELAIEAYEQIKDRQARKGESDTSRAIKGRLVESRRS